MRGFVLLLALLPAASAQITARLELSRAGIPELHLRNGEAASLTAYAVTLNAAPDAEDQTQFVAFFDALIDSTPPLQPDQERIVPVLQRTRPGKRLTDLFQPGTTVAGILEDGSTRGDPVMLRRLIVRRSNMLLAVETALETLSQAGNRNVPRAELVARFRGLADANWRWYVPPEQQVGRALYRAIAEKLKAMPEPALGAPFPPSAFVREETATLNRMRVVLLNSQPGLATGTRVVPQTP